MIIGNVLLLIVLLLLNSFFVSVEFAVVASRRTRLDLLSGEREASVKLVRDWLEHAESRDFLIAACQVGVTIVSLAIGSTGEKVFAGLLEPLFATSQLPQTWQFIEKILPALPLVISLVIVSAIHVVLGEQVPKIATLQNPEKVAVRSARFMDIFGRVFKGFIRLLNWLTRQSLKLFGIPVSQYTSHHYSRAEIKQLFSGPEVEGALDPAEREMLNAVIDLGETVIRKVSIPRTEILALEANAPLDEMIKVIMENTVTKYPVYEENLDAIIGILHIRDLMPMIQHPPDKKVFAKDLVRPAIFVPESISIDNLLLEFRDKKQHLAIVLDEYGGTAGMVTLEDLTEEILGELKDPFDSSIPSIEVREDGSALVDGLTLIDEVNEHFLTNLEDPNYDTIAGYLMGKLGRIPKVGDVFEDTDHNLTLKVESMDHLRIDRILLRKK